MKGNKYAAFAVVMISVALLTLCAAGSAVHAMGQEDHGMTMHHQHQMLNHALAMAVQGSNLVMIGQMQMAPGLDDLTIEHGKKMIKNGMTLFNQTMSGDTMMKMHSAGTTPADNPAMSYTHQLAEAELKVMNLLEKHGDMKGHSMEIHHQHLLLNHALEMALEGSDMMMTGSMGMAPGVDTHSSSHGREMVSDAKNIWNQVMSGDEMMKMHGEGMAPGKDAGMTFTHELAEAQLKVMDLLEKMP